jgi:hypothetical protein
VARPPHDPPPSRNIIPNTIATGDLAPTTVRTLVTFCIAYVAPGKIAREVMTVTVESWK